jgi:ABC-type multidrug transport system ATPase subunit/pSer/pThr/pTyr-binding forkhead associated (FHA) protein/ABC-type multidrug transport system permease subunit
VERFSSPGMPAAYVARITVRRPDGEQQVVSLGTEPVTVGRADGNTIVIKDDWISRRHLEIVRGNDGVYYARDLGSRNGMSVNGRAEQFVALKPGDLVQLGQYLLLLSIDTENQADPTRMRQETRIEGGGPPRSVATKSATNDAVMPTSNDDEGGIAASLTLYGRESATIGRASENDLVLDHPQVSRRHAQVRWNGAQYVISDLNSTNGVYVNGERVRESVLPEGARVQIGPFRFLFVQGALRQQHDHIRLDAINITQEVGDHVLLLRDVAFSILPREFVCIVGGSGAGKSTLLDAISGVRPASHGEVLYNGTNYYANMDEFRSLIGYVPQDDIVPMYLTVEQALTYAARLRLPHDTRPEEIAERVNRALDLMELTARKDVEIHRLSGGQRKRVSIGVELLTEPTLFFLDEPTSGLDPGLETRMMQLMRKVADTDKTVILVTHATQNITLCDKVVFMAPGGYLAFFGPPREALAFFNVETFADIYVLLGQPGAPEEWARRYAESPYHAKYVDARIGRALAAQGRQRGLPPPAVRPDQKLQRAQALSQFKTLTARYIATILKDSRNLVILLLQAPIIALLLGMTYGRNVFTVMLQINAIGQPTGLSWRPNQASTLTTLIVIVALWFGVSNSAREIVKEASIFRRERMVNLRLGPYLASKFVVLMALCLVQNFVMLGMLGLLSPYRLQYPVNFPPRLEPIGGSWVKTFVTLLIVSLAGVALGLLLSAFVANPDRAASIVPIILIPQIIFSGTLIKVAELPVAGKALSWFVAGNWGVQAVGQASGVGAVVNAASQLDAARNNAVAKDPFYIGVWPSILILLAMVVISLAITVWALRRKDVERQLVKLRPQAAVPEPRLA